MSICILLFSTNHVFVLAHRPDVSSLSPLMPGPQQTMWESHCSATLEASGYDALQALDNQPQFPPVWAFWSPGRGPTSPNHWHPAVHAQGQAAQELCIEKKNPSSILFWGLFKCLRYHKQFSVCCPNYTACTWLQWMYLPTVRLAHCEVSVPAKLETTHR